MFSVVIQAGGESSRMGEDKALRPFLGEPLIQRVVRRLRAVAAEMLVTANRPQAYAFLGLPIYPDLIPKRGALGGLYTALSVARQGLVAVVACDMPFVSAELLKALGAALEEQEVDLAIPRHASKTQPFHAVYRRATCLPAVRQAVESGQRRVDAWFPQVRVLYFEEEQVRLYDPQGLCFLNLNTPEEWAQAEELARQQRQDQ